MNIKQNLSSLAWGLVPVAYAVDKATTNVEGEGAFAYTELGSFIRIGMLALIIVAGLAAMLFLIMGGLQYITSGGDKMAAASARDKITYALIGLAVVVGSYALARVIETVFGVSIVSGIAWPGPDLWVGQ